MKPGAEKMLTTVLIDEKESMELRSGEIERVKDRGISTAEDLKKFLEEQEAQAKELLRKKAEKLARGAEDSVSKEVMGAMIKATERLSDVMAATVQNLTIASLRVACAKLSDIVGFELEIDENYVDQFGLTRREKGQETERTPGFAGYREEDMEPWSSVKVEGMLESEVKRKEMEKFDTPEGDIAAVRSGLQKYGTVEYEALGGKGPVLVLMGELHYDSKIMAANFDALKELRKYISVLGAEGVEGELAQGKRRGGVPAGTEDFYRDQMSGRTVGISAIAFEGAFGKDVYTLGVDRMPTVKYFIEKVNKLKSSLDLKSPQMTALVNLNDRIFSREKVTPRDLQEMREITQRILAGGAAEDLTITYRNQLWLGALQKSFLQDSGSHSSGSNIAFLVGGGSHMSDLAVQARSFGFKGVVKFTPTAFNEQLDPDSLATYDKKTF